MSQVMLTWKHGEQKSSKEMLPGMSKLEDRIPTRRDPTHLFSGVHFFSWVGRRKQQIHSHLERISQRKACLSLRFSTFCVSLPALAITFAAKVGYDPLQVLAENLQDSPLYLTR